MTATTIGLRRLDLAAAAAGDPEAVRDRDALVRRGAVPEPAVRDGARATLADVRARGDAAVREANERVGGGRPDGRLVLERRRPRAARDALEPRVRRALDQAIDNVRRFAETQRPTSTRTTILPGIEIERRWTPLASVGAYVPGGSAPYPSSLVMTVVPARVAGVERIVVASPADRDGRNHPVLLGAAGLLEVDAFIVAGGAQAIGALAYGLPDAGLAPVDRIVGPGNAWVTAAKIEVCGRRRHRPAGRPVRGHGPRRAAGRPPSRGRGPHHPGRARPGLPGDPGHDRRRVRRRRGGRRSRELLATAPRRDILERALRDHGRIVLAPDLDAAIAFINAYAPEHLSVDVEPLEPTVARLRNAGSLFVGPWAPESAGDYATGANHVLPTGGLARGVRRPRRRGLRQVRPGPAGRPRRSRRRSATTVATLAEAEGLLAHRDAVEIRFADERPRSHDDEPDPGHVRLADDAVHVHVGGHRRRGRGAVRHPARADRPVRPQHLPHPAGAGREPARRRALRDEPVGVPAVRLPAAGRPRPPRAMGSTPTRSSSGPVPTRSWTSSRRRSSPPGDRAVVPAPDLRDVPGPDRAARCAGRRGATPRRRGRLGARCRRRPCRGRATPRWSGCAARTTRPRCPNPTAPSRRCCAASSTTRRPTVARPPSSSWTRPTRSSPAASLLPLRSAYPNLIVVRTASKAYALAGLRVGFAIARPEVIARLNPYRPPGSVSTVSVTVVTEALRDDGILRREPQPRRDRARAPVRGAARSPAGRSARRSPTSSSSTSAHPSGRRAVAEALLRRGLVPRTFPAGHVLAGSLRLTVRDPDENDRLINAANEIAAPATAGAATPSTTESPA